MARGSRLTWRQHSADMCVIFTLNKNKITVIVAADKFLFSAINIEQTNYFYTYLSFYERYGAKMILMSTTLHAALDRHKNEEIGRKKSHTRSELGVASIATWHSEIQLKFFLVVNRYCPYLSGRQTIYILVDSIDVVTCRGYQCSVSASELCIPLNLCLLRANRATHNRTNASTISYARLPPDGRHSRLILPTLWNFRFPLAK